MKCKNPHCRKTLEKKTGRNGRAIQFCDPDCKKQFEKFRYNVGRQLIDMIVADAPASAVDIFLDEVRGYYD